MYLSEKNDLVQTLGLVAGRAAGKTKRFANAFRFGLREGNRTGFVPLSLSTEGPSLGIVFQAGTPFKQLNALNACIYENPVDFWHRARYFVFQPHRLKSNLMQLR